MGGGGKLPTVDFWDVCAWEYIYSPWWANGSRTSRVGKLLAERIGDMLGWENRYSPW